MSEARFGPFRLDLARRELKRDGEFVLIGGRALEILCVLVTAGGDVVSKDDLMTQVWPGLVVEENNIQVHISTLRKALGEGKGGGSYVVTVPGRGYRFVGIEPACDGPASISPSGLEYPALPDKPSIAVLPFANLSGDTEQAYFADGIAEDIITALTRFRWFFVIARSSSFTYRGGTVDVKQIARELGVRYVLEGSVRRSANRVRISAQLVDATTGAHIWAERYDRDLAEIFVVQDEITERVAGAIEPELLKAEGRPMGARLAGKLTAWDLIRQGMWNFHQLTEPTHRRSLELFREAARVAPELAEAQMWVSRAATGLVAYGWCSDPDALLRDSLQAALLAVRLDEKDAYSHFALSMTYVFSGELEQAVRAAEKSAELSPSFALAHVGLGMTLLYSGRAQDAIDPLQRGLRLNPFDPQNTHWFRLLALALYFSGKHPEALAAAHRAVKARPGWPLTLETAAICHVALGQIVEGRACLEQMHKLAGPNGDPTRMMKLRNPKWADEITAQLRKAAARPQSPR
ncbi:winged helix-turn-helix domain-containing tetratricopeptide repeat protein [Bradyrhizobium sp. LMG 9283]|uniref:winged helix-turn-helix domain-containing tetratricopeptide repeat protein n=1 Tax=Bradyrhizobium sp. LMG 9283 TaxID=592064 RepID=UPI00388FC81E